MRRTQAEHILHESAKTYDNISLHFSQTRNSPGPWHFKLARNIKPGAVVLDIGCGNGRFIETLPSDVEYIGIDISGRLLDEARKKYPKHKKQFINFDGIHIPFKSGKFSDIFMLATLHHVPGELKKDLLVECKRVLKKGGTLTLSAWYLWRKPMIGYFVATLPKKLFNHSLDLFDIYVPWKDHNGKMLGKRYFHMFYKSELARLLRQTGFESVSVSIVEPANQKNYLIKAHI